MEKNKYRKALKNYCTGRFTDSVGKIQQMLVDFGASGIGFEYDGQGMIISIRFKISVGEGNERMINLPLRTYKVAKILEEQGYLKRNDDAYPYRVALANVRDWLDAQLTLVTTEMVELTEIFLPYIVDKSGMTLYEVVKKNNYLLPEPKDEKENNKQE